jgi:hypothetical protein
VVQTNPKDVDALVERSYTYYELGQPTNAMADCEAAIAIDPLCHDAFTVKAGTVPPSRTHSISIIYLVIFYLFIYLFNELFINLLFIVYFLQG